ncbi:MAG: hypothetical protein QS721_06260 [Candidatus Endonucleobacter sp. (ex Gigantidas childressi)]|nr:hypothetical protein [Candidatus Endonucleobacter sp. (ex Gigantidas childressi)]
MYIKKVVFICMALISVESFAQNIYKCMVDGRVEFSEEHCKHGGNIVESNEISAPLEAYDMSKAAKLDYTIERNLLKEKISRRQYEIQHLINEMNAEIEELKGNVYKPTRTTKKSKYKSVSASKLKLYRPDGAVNGYFPSNHGALTSALRVPNYERVSEQVNATVKRYQTMIKAKEFQISLLMEELRDLKE